MLVPVWIAFAPEVHSSLLGSGPGPGPLLSAAGAWTSLSAQYTAAADELTGLLGAVQTGAWRGSSAEQYVAAHVPYLTWLLKAGVDSAGNAARHETAAAAYTAALASMPTLAELAANHITHGILVATNFFGINTIPIALNEADYVRMWIQAAMTMSVYHGVSDAALAAVAPTEPSPMVVKTDNPLAAQQAPPPPSSGNVFTDMFNQLGQLLQNPSQTIAAIMADPTPWLPLLFFIAYEAFFIPFGTTFWSVVLSSPAIALPIAIGAGVYYLNTLGAEPAPDAADELPEIPAPAADQPMSLAGAAPALPATTTPAVPPAQPVAAAPPPPVTPAAGVIGFGYLVGGAHPGEGFGPTLVDRTKAQAPAARVPAAAAAARSAASDRSRARRRRRARMRGYGDEFMDMNESMPPSTAEGPGAASVTESAAGGGPLGFTGTLGKTSAAAAGLATLTGDEFGDGPVAPMVPDSWREDGSERPATRGKPETSEKPRTIRKE